MSVIVLGEQVDTSRRSWLGRWGVFALVVLWVGVVCARVLGPSDLYDKEQPRTTSYTVDMIKGGHWVMPHDTFGIPATKPPLYNWLSVPFVMLGGFVEGALKMPSVLASGAVVVMLVFYGRRMGRRAEMGGGTGGTGNSNNDWMTLGVVAGMIWLASPVTEKLLYVARPDMLLTACLMGAWYAATVLIQAEAGERRIGAAIGFWLCTLLAALDKGPLALFGVIYLVLGAFLIRRDWRVLLKTGWWWGIPLVAFVMGWWVVAARAAEPEFFSQVLLGREMADRVAGPRRFFTTFLNGPAYLITRFLPWSLVVIVALWKIGVRRWFSHPLSPAILWLLIWLIVFSFATTKRPDRYAPVYPPLAVMAAYFLLYEVPWRVITVGRVAAVAALMIVGLCVHNQFFSEPAATRLGDHVRDFAREVREKTHGEPVLFLDGEQTPLETLLGNVQTEPPDADFLRNVEWEVRMVTGEDEPGRVAVSELIAQVDGREPGRLGLYVIAFGEGKSEYEHTLDMAVLYEDATGKGTTVGTAASAGKLWLQFWRLHKPVEK